MLKIHEDIDDQEQVREYYEYRARQLQGTSFRWLMNVQNLEDWGVRTWFVNGEATYESAYILKSHRGKGHINTYMRKIRQWPILTLPDCKMTDYLRDHSIPFEEVSIPEHQTIEFAAIEAFYNGRRAKRSGVLYMNHILEGLTVMKWFRERARNDQFFDTAARAYCLHPMFQEDAELKGSAFHFVHKYEFSAAVMMLVMEYRSVANEYLSARDIERFNEIRLSPITEVNLMLIADKVQNYKDFIQHHIMTHPNKERLDRYFGLWLQRLDVSSQDFTQVIETISHYDSDS